MNQEETERSPMEFQQIVGAQIRMYRKKAGLSLEELAAKIYKSKSIVSKYELGQSNIDIATLQEISQALHIDIKCLLDNPNQSSQGPSLNRFGIFSENRLYVYIMEKDRRKFIIHRGLLSLYDENDGSTSATLYMDIADFSDHTKCGSIYSGKMLCTPYNASMLLTDVQESSEKVSFFMTINKSSRNLSLGFYFGYTMVDNLPFSTNAIISKVPLAESDALVEALMVTKEKLTLLKNGNVYTGNDFILETDLIK